jgi:hypothetical protein
MDTVTGQSTSINTKYPIHNEWYDRSQRSPSYEHNIILCLHLIVFMGINLFNHIDHHHLIPDTLCTYCMYVCIIIIYFNNSGLYASNESSIYFIYIIYIILYTLYNNNIILSTLYLRTNYLPCFAGLSMVPLNVCLWIILYTPSSTLLLYCVRIFIDRTNDLYLVIIYLPKYLAGC